MTEPPTPNLWTADWGATTKMEQQTMLEQPRELKTRKEPKKTWGMSWEIVSEPPWALP
jgi:hypothetical protein